VIRLGDPLPASFSPRYKGQLLVHGMGFSPDHRTIAVVAIGSNAVNFIDTATNSVKHVNYVGRSRGVLYGRRKRGLHDIDRLVTKAFPFTPQRSIGELQGTVACSLHARSRCSLVPNLHHESVYSN
jgi:hypothetical protein